MGQLKKQLRLIQAYKIAPEQTRTSLVIVLGNWAENLLDEQDVTGAFQLYYRIKDIDPDPAAQNLQNLAGRKSKGI